MDYKTANLETYPPQPVGPQCLVQMHASTSLRHVTRKVPIAESRRHQWRSRKKPGVQWTPRSMSSRAGQLGQVCNWYLSDCARAESKRPLCRKTMKTCSACVMQNIIFLCNIALKMLTTTSKIPCSR